MKRILLLLASALLIFGCQKEVYHNITVSVNPTEGGSVSPSTGPVLDGAAVSFRATPKGDYVFTGWSGSISGTENPKNVTVTQDMNVIANFTLRSYPLTITVEGDGTVDEKVISTKSEYKSGTVVELTATPSDHWLFDHWEGDITGSTNPAQITVSNAKSVKAVFVEKNYPLTIEIVGNGTVKEEVISTKSSYQEGTTVKLTAVPDEFWKFDHWEGDIEGKDNPTSIDVVSDTKVIAVFIRYGLEENGTANCYIVSEQGEFSFPLVKGNSDIPVTGAVSVNVLWETRNDNNAISNGELINDVSLIDNRICFKTSNPLQNGNALIAAHNADGKILWSWHIWICEGFDPLESAQEYPNKAGQAMDRDLGALSPQGTNARGLLYQWGRKDPFIGWSGRTEGWFGWNMDAAREHAQSTLFENSAVPIEVALQGKENTLQYSIENPTIFIYSESSPWDWFAGDKEYQNNELWGAYDKKSIYDPSPAGWRVPVGGENGFWDKAGISTTTMIIPGSEGQLYRFGGYPAIPEYWNNARGRIFVPNGAWFTTSGFRSGRNGNLGGGGHYAVYWTTSVDEYFADAMHFGFYGEVYPSEVNVRNYGFSIRCIKE